MAGKIALPKFNKADNVKGHRKCLGKIQRNPDRPADLKPQRTRNNRIRAAGADFDVRYHRGHRKRRTNRDTVGEQNDDDRFDQTDVADHPAQPQIHNDAEYRQNRRREYAFQRA